MLARQHCGSQYGRGVVLMLWSGFRGPWELLQHILLVQALMRSISVKVREHRPMSRWDCWGDTHRGIYLSPVCFGESAVAEGSLVRGTLGREFSFLVERPSEGLSKWERNLFWILKFLKCNFWAYFGYQLYIPNLGMDFFFCQGKKTKRQKRKKSQTLKGFFPPPSTPLIISLWSCCLEIRGGVLCVSVTAELFASCIFPLLPFLRRC